MIQKLLTTTLLVLQILPAIQAQKKSNEPANLNKITKVFYAEYEKQIKDGKLEKEDKEGDGVIQQFKRWQWLMRSRTWPSGNMPDPGIQWKEWSKLQNEHPEMMRATTPLPAWSQVGNNIVPTQGGGAGRINVVRVDPNNNNVIWLATAGGGVWKSTNGGTSWVALSDKFPVTSIADIAIDPTNSNNVYVATGDESGYVFGGYNDFWGGVYSAGVLRTVNGGTTWSKSFPSLQQSDNETILRLLIHPSNNKILLGASTSGIYRTADGGATLNQVLNAYCYDMEWKPGNANVVYAAGNGNIYKSSDAGLTWSVVRTGMGSGRISLEVSDANAEVVYAVSQAGVCVRSGDGGTTWTNKAFPSGATFYGYYDMAFGVSPDNADVLYAGGLNTVKSTNGGTSWANVDIWYNYTSASYVHADKHGFAFLKGQPNTALAATDGGIFKTVNGGTSWTDLSNGLMIAQIYRLGTTPQNSNLYISGWQDNGCNVWNGTSWVRAYGGDGMEAAINPTDQNMMFECYQNGGLQRSTNGGASWSYISPSGGDWVTPFVLDPVTPGRMYYGGYSAYRSDNNGSSWTLLNGVGLGTAASAIAVAPSDNNVVYFASFGKIVKYNVSANTSVNITGSLPVNLAGINYIAVNNTDANELWVCMGGYNAGQKVFYSANGGTSWTNVSGSLPNLPVNSIVYQNNSNDRVYIGTDIGCFYKDNSMANWKAFNNGLPNVMVHELEINYTSNKLVAATYGRGIWQADIISPAPPVASEKIWQNTQGNHSTIQFSLSPNPANDYLQVNVQNITERVLVSVFRIDQAKQLMSGKYSVEQARSFRLNVSSLQPGTYALRIQSGTQVASKEFSVQR
jgi:photosystem II stability/assembly factor-like uncharacterized protein